MYVCVANKLINITRTCLSVGFCSVCLFCVQDSGVGFVLGWMALLVCTNVMHFSSSESGLNNFGIS